MMEESKPLVSAAAASEPNNTDKEKPSKMPSQNGDTASDHPSTILGVEFAPLNVPLTRRRQTAIVIYYVFMTFFFPIVGTFTLGYLVLFTRYWYLGLLYVAWMYYDRHTPSTGARPIHFLRTLGVWDHFRAYFPMKMEKMSELDPKKNYIFGYHPHGIIATGCWGHFGVCARFQQLFPGITPFVCTLKANFMMPFSRDHLLLFGVCDVGRPSLMHLLTKQGTGNAVVIVIGGAQEAFDARPLTAILKLANRKGFVKIAIQTGADLVPVFSFGENDLFSQAESTDDSKVRRFQEYMKKLTTISPIIFHGRGVFNYTFGFLPYRREIHTIVGKPIVVTKNATPTQEEIDDIHAQYTDSLRHIFDTHKEKHGFTATTELKFY